MKTIPKRKCVGCNNMKEKDELIRIVKSGDKSVNVDRTGKADGRGAYICKDATCLKTAESKRALERAFKMQVSSEIYKKLGEEINNE